MNVLIKYLLFLGLLFCGYYAWQKFSAPPPPPPLTAASKIVMYVTPEGAAFYSAALKFKGLTCGVVPITDLDKQMKELNLTERLVKEGVMKNDRISTPFYSVDGRLITGEAFNKALEALPFKIPLAYKPPYILLYGVENCGFAQQAREDLEANGLPYEFRNVNDDRYQPRFRAMLAASGNKSFEWPILEVNGKLLIKPSMEEVKKYHAVQP